MTIFLIELAYLSALLFVCLSVTNIAQKVKNGLQGNFLEGFTVVKGTSDNFGGDLDHHADFPIVNPTKLFSNF